ncbi:hypothetical protein NST28_22425 [Paenibacillus sp. FSL R10-2791]|uniref:hypothetical protein n=1 Tax=Paenibacillus sp. FSL R10-2791 TaxID=2954695 RepID=UPI0030FC54E6
MAEVTWVGNAKPPQVLEGVKVFSGTGTMKNNGAINIVPSIYSQRIEEGYHSGLGGVAGVSVPAAKVLSDTTIAGVKGTMPNKTRGAMGGYTNAVSAKGDGLTALVMEPPTGYYEAGKNTDGYGTLLAVDANFVPSSILATKTVFGVQGSVPVIAGYDTAQNVGIWPDGGLAVYPNEGYRKGGVGVGEIKVTVDQMRTVMSILKLSRQTVSIPPNGNVNIDVSSVGNFFKCLALKDGFGYAYLEKFEGLNRGLTADSMLGISHVDGATTILLRNYSSVTLNLVLVIHGTA